MRKKKEYSIRSSIFNSVDNRIRFGSTEPRLQWNTTPGSNSDSMNMKGDVVQGIPLHLVPPVRVTDITKGRYS